MATIAERVACKDRTIAKGRQLRNEELLLSVNSSELFEGTFRHFCEKCFSISADLSATNLIFRRQIQ